MAVPDAQPLSGGCGLLPVQQWYFSCLHSVDAVYNQSVLLGLNKSIDDHQLEAAWMQLQQHHDALRFRYVQAEGGWEQVYTDQYCSLEIIRLDNDLSFPENGTLLLSVRGGR